MTTALGRGGDPRLLLDELLHTIRTAIADQPRSRQTRIGPSELGITCDRRISYKLRGTPEVNTRQAPWLPTVGTAVHAWLEDVFGADNVHRLARGEAERWLLEQRVSVGNVGEEEITGSCDLYDTATGSVIDWKTTGKTRLDAYRRNGPSNQYRVQAHAYGRGWARKGYDVETVAICFLPRNAELDSTVWWSEPYDESVAVAALARAEAITMVNAALGEAAPAVMSTTDSECGYCPWFALNSTDLTTACPGDPARPKPGDSIRSLIAPTSQQPVQAKETAR
jgi:hypothetical protein